MHIGVFIILLLSGERNFGVRLNKPYATRVPMDIPVFTGTHADLLIVVFHKIITTGHQKLQPLFDCLLTIIVNGKWLGMGKCLILLFVTCLIIYERLKVLFGYIDIHGELIWDLWIWKIFYINVYCTIRSAVWYIVDRYKPSHDNAFFLLFFTN